MKHHTLKQFGARSSITTSQARVFIPSWATAKPLYRYKGIKTLACEGDSIIEHWSDWSSKQKVAARGFDLHCVKQFFTLASMDALRVTSAKKLNTWVEHNKHNIIIQ